MHELPNVNVKNNLINELCTENEHLQREVLLLGNIENLSKPELSCNRINKNPHQNNRITYLRVFALTVSYGDKELSEITLLDSGSNFTLVSKYLADSLDLSGQEREI